MSKSQASSKKRRFFIRLPVSESGTLCKVSDVKQASMFASKIATQGEVTPSGSEL